MDPERVREKNVPTLAFRARRARSPPQAGFCIVIFILILYNYLWRASAFMSVKLILDNHFVKAAWDLIINSKKSIDISFYKAEPFQVGKRNKVNVIYQALLLKKKEGVDVRLLLNKEQPVKGVSRFNMATASFLRERNIFCRYLNNFRCCHSKIILVDSYSFYIGSHNLSNNALTRNFETGIIASDNVLGLELKQRFEDLWTSGRDFP